MLKKFGLACILLVGTAAPALADPSSCSEPIAPVAVDGGNATEAQMNSAHDDVVNFVKASDDYQSCLFRDLNDQTEAAKKAKKDLDPSIAADIQARVDANQKMKERVGTEFNGAVLAFKAKHPNG
jgi:hypothetical protein